MYIFNKLSPTISVFIVDASGMVKLWHFTTGACLHTTNEARQSLCSTLSGERDKYAVAGSDPRIHIYDVHTKMCINTLEPRSVSGRECGLYM